MWFLCLNQSCEDELGFHIWVECNVTAASMHLMYATLLGSCFPCDPTSGKFSNECVLLFTAVNTGNNQTGYWEAELSLWGLVDGACWTGDWNPYGVD